MWETVKQSKMGRHGSGQQNSGCLWGLRTTLHSKSLLESAKQNKIYILRKSHNIGITFIAANLSYFVCDLFYSGIWGGLGGSKIAFHCKHVFAGTLVVHVCLYT